MTTPDFYLASAEGYGLESPHACFILRRLRSERRDDFLLVRIDPSIIGQPFGLGDKDIDEVIIATRHQGDSLFPIRRWPVDIHVLRPLVRLGDAVIRNDEFQSVAWAALYRSEQDARNKRLD